jgi:hypothetical protein
MGRTEKNSTASRGGRGCQRHPVLRRGRRAVRQAPEVKDAHDRYANIEVGYLLQKMEEYEGIAIPGHQSQEPPDSAFLRR